MRVHSVRHPALDQLPIEALFVTVQYLYGILFYFDRHFDRLGLTVFQRHLCLDNYGSG